MEPNSSNKIPHTTQATAPVVLVPPQKKSRMLVILAILILVFRLLTFRSLFFSWLTSPIGLAVSLISILPPLGVLFSRNNSTTYRISRILVIVEVVAFLAGVGLLIFFLGSFR